ncbi:hypothetical protein JCM18920_1494 [Cutibacterium acnes JCM 18920]|nr:hypothetical protein JCM18920_1494 [Cutibacterium acnes JCM 18920]
MKAQKQGEMMRINATRTPLPPVRSMTASQLKIGDLVAGHTADGSYPFHVERADSYDGMVHLRLIEISHASGLTDEQHPGIESVHAPDEPVITLSRHFGVCSECGSCRRVPTSWLSVVWRNYGRAKPKKPFTHQHDSRVVGILLVMASQRDHRDHGRTPSFCLAHPDRSRRGSRDHLGVKRLDHLRELAWSG